MRALSVARDSFRLKEPFTISRGTVTSVDVVTVSLQENGFTGWGECRPYARYDETCESVTRVIEQFRQLVEAGADRMTLNSSMPAGSARNAIDSALWDLEAKTKGTRAWALAGLDEPKPSLVTYTISLGSPADMAKQAKSANRPLLKLKLGGDGDLERVAAVREASPDSRLIVDANESWNANDVLPWARRLAELDVELIEQPLHANADSVLSGIKSPVPLCADESCHTAHDVAMLRTKYDFVNIKLDKTGGLTAAMELAQSATRSELGIMLGCMMSSSLSMAPAFLLASQASFVDLDAPLLLADDRKNPLAFDAEILNPPQPELWG